MNNDPQLVQELVDSGLHLKIHNKLVYFSVTAQEAKKLTGHEQEGWVVPYRDTDGKPYQHNGKDFYRLKPRGFKDGSPKYLSPAKAGCRPYFSPLFPEGQLGTGRDLFITEGEKKADCLNLNHVPTIGLSGIWCWKDQRSGDSQPIPELEVEFSQVKDAEKAARDTLDQLADKGLLDKRKTMLEGKGDVVLFRPYGADLSKSDMSVLWKYPPDTPHPPDPLKCVQPQKGLIHSHSCSGDSAGGKGSPESVFTKPGSDALTLPIKDANTSCKPRLEDDPHWPPRPEKR